MKIIFLTYMLILALPTTAAEQSAWKPYRPPCTERENVFAFTEQPRCKYLGDDKYEITFAVKGYCDVTVAIVDPSSEKELIKGRGVVVRHLASGVLGANAPAPFQKNSLKQTIYWDGKDDLDAYLMEPQKMTVRVSLGLKPEFEKSLGASSPYSLPGHVIGLVASEEGVFALIDGAGQGGHKTIRHFGHDGEYVKTVFPPPASLPKEKLEGFWWVEYEPGKWSVLGTELEPNYLGRSYWMPYGVDGSGPQRIRPVIHGRKIYFGSSGAIAGNPKTCKPKLHWLNTDGSSELAGILGREYFSGPVPSLDVQFAISPDGRRAYMTGLFSRKGGVAPAALVFDVEGKEPAKIFVGKADGQWGTSGEGSDDKSLNFPSDIVCDKDGRVYIADKLNHRVQIFDGDGRFLKTIKAASPEGVQVHHRTGEIYILCAGRVDGKSVGRMAKHRAYPDCELEFARDGMTGGVFALDSWATPARCWLGRVDRFGDGRDYSTLDVWEEQEKGFRKVLDFMERAQRDAGENYHGRWSGDGVGEQVHCDPTREEAYLNRSSVFNLGTGRFLGRRFGARGELTSYNRSEGWGSSLAFDKRGFMHAQDPRQSVGFHVVSRFDPERNFTEVPYDYGEEKGGFVGAINLPRVGRHPCGIGVNMRGDLAVALNQEVIPKLSMEKDFREHLVSEHRMTGRGVASYDPYVDMLKNIEEDRKRGVLIPFMPREPGLPWSSGTIWTWDSNGELREEMAVIAGQRINGVQMDEDGHLYFSNCRFALADDRPFLEGRTLLSGTNKMGTHFTGSFLKTRGTKVRFRCLDAQIPMDSRPTRPANLTGPAGGWGYGPDKPVWVEGVEWVYAGASLMKPCDCMCYQIRPHVDWFKRSYVPEYYRHSIGILDSAGNLILHVGRYGNYDSGRGPESPIPLDGDGIGMTLVRHVSGTDNFLAFSDWSERLLLLKLSYHAEETVRTDRK